jgi:hypothetical protein
MNRRFILTENERKEIKKLYEEFDSEKITKGFFDLVKQRLNEPSSNSTPSDDTTTPSSSDTTSTSDETESTSSKITDYSQGGTSDFLEITKKVIDKFEGGYWNPQCAGLPGSKHPSKTGMYSRSGETMYGLDREAGAIEKASPTNGVEFFKIIDDEKQKMGLENFCAKWKWNYRGGELKDKLMDLAAKIMKDLYERNARSFFKGKTKEVVESSKPLTLHFSYATWNGPGFFQYFAKSMNQAIEQGKSIPELVEIAKKDRDAKFGSTAWSGANEKVKAAIDAEAGTS